MEPQTHFTALLTFAAVKPGGPTTPASSGYRPVLKFSFELKSVLAILNFPDAELVFPGDTVTAEIILPGAVHLTDKLYKGLDFEFFEGDIFIGSGVITGLSQP